MRTIFMISEKLHEKTHWKVSSIFLVLNILCWCLLALAVALLGIYARFGGVMGHEVLLICIVGYTGLILGFLGGVWYLDRQGY